MPGQVAGRRRPARRRRHRAVRRPLPQGGHRQRSTTRSCARWRSGCATCASSRSAGPRCWSRSARRASSTPRWRRRSSPPTPRPGWRTSTCRSSPSGGPRRRSPARPGWSRWPTCCSATRPRTRSARRPATSTPSGASPTPPRRWTAPGRSWSSGSPRTPTSSASCASACGPAAGSSRRSATARQGRPAPSSPTTSTSPSRCTTLPSHRILAMFRGREGGGARRLTVDPDPPHPAVDDTAGRLVARLRARGSPARFGIADQGRAGRPVAAGHGALGLADPDPGVASASTCAMRLRQAAEEDAVGGVRREPARPAAGRARPAPAPRWASTPACAPASRSPSSTPPARSSPPTRSTRTSRADGWDDALATLTRLARAHEVDLIAIGNGTASRETDKLAGELIAAHPGARADQGHGVARPARRCTRRRPTRRPSCPSLDVSLRGAVSIARRLQDPLAELVKIDPKSIGVGQYQHDLSESALSRSLDAVVEDCVNAVGVDVNTASVPLLRRVSGITEGLADAASSRTATRNGPFRSRTALQSTCRGSARRRSSSAPASCGSAAATTRSTAPACTPRPTRWCAGSSRRPAATSRR